MSSHPLNTMETGDKCQSCESLGSGKDLAVALKDYILP